jgi:hypothetical protein
MHINQGKSKVPFQVVANCRLLIVLHPSLMNEVRNDDRMTFRAWLKQVIHSIPLKT